MFVSLRIRSVLRIKFKTTQRKKIKVHKLLSHPASRVAFKLCRRLKELCLQEHEYGKHTIVQNLSKILLNNYSMHVLDIIWYMWIFTPYPRRASGNNCFIKNPPPLRYRKLKPYF